MKFLQKISKLFSKYTSIIVILVAIFTFIVPSSMSWVNFKLFTDPVGNNFTNQSIVLGLIMFSMGLTLTTKDFKNLAKKPLHIVYGVTAQYIVMPLIAYLLVKLFNLPVGIALGLILVGCCPGGVSSNIMAYLCGGDVAFSVGMTTISTLLSPIMTSFMVSFLANGAEVSIKALPMFVSIIETVIIPILFGFLLNALWGKTRIFKEIQLIMPGVAVMGLSCVVGGVIASQGSKFFTLGLTIFSLVVAHNIIGYILGYLIGHFTGMNISKKRTISIEVGMQNAGLATNLATTSTQFAAAPDSAVVAAIACVWHSISGALIAGVFSIIDNKKISSKKLAEK
ncbi:sodium transporter [Candidatus Epulonipiscioides gigas]|nr:sodium transporter [Epulopiscium sp. SCG-C07WGA-EpuloA2]